MGEYPKTEAQDRVAYDAIDCLTVLYSQLNEHDMWTGTSFFVFWLFLCFFFFFLCFFVCYQYEMKPFLAEHILL